jgi:UDP-N-acetyl-2-amino-2-deoxyglucuronate dehydrogenase
VHRTHLLLEVLGTIDEVFAYTELFEPVRRSAEVELTTTGEDAAVVVLRFASGALGHWMCATAAHGERTSGVWLYGSRGVVRLGQYFKSDDESTIDWANLVKRYAPELPSGAFAHSYLELADAIEHDGQPVASAERATEALGVVFAALEAATLGHPVKVTDVLCGRTHAYEDTVINEMEQLCALP